MKEISGRLAMLGSGTISSNQIGKSFIKYNSIEIGDQILQNVRTAKALDDYLSRAVGEDVTLYVRGKFFVGAKLPHGKVYFWRRSWTAVIFSALYVLLPGTLIGGLSGHFVPAYLGMAVLCWLIMGNELMHILSDQPKLAAMGGTPLKS